LRIDALERVSPLAWKGHQFDEAIQLAVEAAELARANSRPGKLAVALNLLGRILLEQGEYDRAEEILQEGVRVALQHLYLFNPGCPLTLLDELALARGEWETAKTYLAQAVPLLEDGESSPLVGAHLAMARTDLAELALARSDTLRAQHLCSPFTLLACNA
jgi:tetratricopeptide (TPR) repeat protein